MVTILNYLKAWLKQIVCDERKKLESPTRKIAFFSHYFDECGIARTPSEITVDFEYQKKLKKKFLLKQPLWGLCVVPKLRTAKGYFVLNEWPFPEGHGRRTGPKVTDTRDNSYPTFSLFSVVLGIQILTVFTVSYPTLPHNHRNVHKC